MQLLLSAPTDTAEDDTSWFADLINELVSGKVVAGYIVVVLTAVVFYVLFRKRGLHVVIDASVSTLPVEAGGSLSLVTVDVVNRGKKELPLVQCQVVRPATPDDAVILPKWTTVDNEEVTGGKWPKPVLKQEIGVTVRMAFAPSALNGLERAKAQIGQRFKARYADVKGEAPRSSPGNIESG